MPKGQFLGEFELYVMGSRRSCSTCARDPLILGAACAAVLGSAVLAAILPARRALRADSASALRTE
jgi:hypothetical protein